MAKILSSSNKGFGADGGPTGQVGRTSGPARSTGPQKAGSSSQEGSGNGMWMAGGHGNHMAPHSGAGNIKPGQEANPMNGKVGTTGSGVWAEGGSSNGMAPNRGSQRAKGGCSSAY